MSKKDLNETEICQNFITPAIVGAGWDKLTQIRREYSFTAGRVIVRGKVAVRGVNCADASCVVVPKGGQTANAADGSCIALP